MRKYLTGLIFLLCLIAFNTAAEAKSGEMSVSTLTDGDEIIYSFSLTPESGIRTANFVVYFDPEQLTFMDFGKGPLLSLQNTLFAASYIDTTHAIQTEYFSFNDNADGGTLFNVRFRHEGLSGTGAPAIGIYIEGFYNAQGEHINASVTGDASVAVLDRDEKITDEAVSGRSVEKTTEVFEIDTILSEPSTELLSVNTLQEDESVKEGARLIEEEAARSVQPFPWWGYVILGLVLLYGFIIIVRTRRSIKK